MSAPVEVASSSSSKELCLVGLDAKLVLWIYQQITPEHKDSLCKIAAIAAACHTVRKEKMPENFGKVLAFELYSAARGDEYKPRDTRIVTIQKRTDKIVYASIDKKSTLAGSMVNIEMGVRRYQVKYVLMIDFKPIIVSNRYTVNISSENRLLTPPADFYKIFEDMKTPHLTKNGTVLDTDVQQMVNEITRICQPAQVARTIEGSLAVTLDVRIKLNTDVEIVGNDKYFISRRIALIIVMHLAHKIQSQWIDFNLHTTWELFLKLQETNYAEPLNLIRLHYEVDKVNIDGSKNMASVFKGQCSINMKNKSYKLNYNVNYAYQPNPPQKISKDLLPGEVVVSLHAAPLQFSTLVNEVERRRYNFAERSNVTTQGLADEVETVCLPAEMN